MARPTGLVDQYGRPLRIERRTAERTRQPRAIVDAAQTTIENERHWANADGRSASAVATPDVRKRLRERSRYECLNNSYASGLVTRLANDNIGTGPRIQVSIPGASDEDMRTVEQRFTAWANDRAVDFSEKLRVLDESAIRDGECFGVFTSNPAIEDPVKLDLRLIEADQVATPGFFVASSTATDGIVYDKAGNPVEYHVLKTHPGDAIWSNALDYTKTRAEIVVHWYCPSRPNELRGLPEITAALPLFAMLRRYTLAVIQTAENAAQISGVLETDLPPGEGAEAVADEMEIIEAVRGAYVSLPRGMTLNGHKPEQPTTEYENFVRQILNEIGCAVRAPLNVVSGNSSGYNFSSGRLDHIPYHRAAWIRRNRKRARVLNPTARMWAVEAVMIPGHLPANLPPVDTWTIDWQWDGFDSIDPEAEAAVDEQELTNNTTTLAEVCARKGTDWKAVLTQRAAEKAFAESLGLDMAEAESAVVRPAPADANAKRAARNNRRQARPVADPDADTVLESEAVYA